MEKSSAESEILITQLSNEYLLMTSPYILPMVNFCSHIKSFLPFFLSFTLGIHFSYCMYTGIQYNIFYVLKSNENE